MFRTAGVVEILHSKDFFMAFLFLYSLFLVIIYLNHHTNFCQFLCIKNNLGFVLKRLLEIGARNFKNM